MSTTKSEQGESAQNTYDFGIKLNDLPHSSFRSAHFRSDMGVQSNIPKSDLVVINLSPTSPLSQEEPNGKRMEDLTSKKLEEFGEVFETMKKAFNPTYANWQSF